MPVHGEGERLSTNRMNLAELALLAGPVLRGAGSRER